MSCSSVMEPIFADAVGLKIARWSSIRTQSIQAREKSSATVATQKLSDRLRRLQGGLSEPAHEKFGGQLNRFGFDTTFLRQAQVRLSFRTRHHQAVGEEIHRCPRKNYELTGMRTGNANC